MKSGTRLSAALALVVPRATNAPSTERPASTPGSTSPGSTLPKSASPSLAKPIDAEPVLAVAIDEARSHASPHAPVRATAPPPFAQTGPSTVTSRAVPSALPTASSVAAKVTAAPITSLAESATALSSAAPASEKTLLIENPGQLRVVARIPDMRVLVQLAKDEPTPARSPWSNFQVRIPKLNVDYAAAWAWAIALPPVVKLGVGLFFVVIGVWVFSDKGKTQPESSALPPIIVSSNQDANASVADKSSTPGERTASKNDGPWRWDGKAETTNAKSPSANSPVVNDGPSLREIEESAKRASASSQPTETAPQGRLVAPANVQPIPVHHEPRDTTWPDEARSTGNQPASANLPRDAGENPPEMARTYGERSAASQNNGVGIQYNPFAEPSTRPATRTADRGPNEPYSSQPSRGGAPLASSPNGATRAARTADDDDAYRRAYSRSADRRNENQGVSVGTQWK